MMTNGIGLRGVRGIVSAGAGLLLAALAAGTAQGQALLSQTTWGGPGSDVARGVALAADGSSYVVGESDSFTTDQFGQPRRAISLVKFAPDGSLAWQRLWTGLTAGAGGVALSHDAASVYVAGTTFDNGGDALLLKFDANGSLVWQRAWGQSESDSGHAVATGADGSVHLVVNSRTNDGDASLVIVKFDAAGATQWQKAWAGVAGFEAAAVAPDGGVVAAGTRLRPDSGFSQFDVVVVKTDSSGELEWDRTYTAGEIVDPRGGMAISPDGSIVIAGAIQAEKGGIIGISSLLIKLDANGNLLFDREWGGKNGNAAAGVAVAPDGSIYFAGAGSGFVDGNEKAFVVHVQANGKAAEAATWGGTGFDSGAGVRVGADGTVVLAATTTTAPPYSLLEVSRKASAVRGTVAEVDGVFGDAVGVATEPGAAVVDAGGSTTYSGNFETALVRLRLIP